MKTFGGRNKQVSKAGSLENRVKDRNTVMYLILLPSLIMVLIFNYLPLLGLVIAFQDFDAFSGILGSPWVGFQNFIKIFTYPDFLKAIKNTFVYSAVNLFLGFPLPIILALLFNEISNRPFKRVVQTISYFPHFLSWAAICSFVYALFALEGPVNSALAALIGDSYVSKNILLDSKNFLAILFGVGQWQGIGWSTIIYLAAISGIDGSLYEAAEIDGCNRFRMVMNITWPCIKGTAVLVLILGLGSLVTSNFEMVYGLQNAFIQQDTEVINTLVYRQGIQGGEYSMATALGLMQGIVSLVIVFLANKISKGVSGESLW